MQSDAVIDFKAARRRMLLKRGALAERQDPLHGLRIVEYLKVNENADRYVKVRFLSRCGAVECVLSLAALFRPDLNQDEFDRLLRCGFVIHRDDLREFGFSVAMELNQALRYRRLPARIISAAELERLRWIETGSQRP